MSDAPLSNEQMMILNRIGNLADQCDNMNAAARMPLPADVHLPILRTGLLDMRDELRSIYESIAGENPWRT